ncbi:TPM domain-containing protein [Gracilibacillus dipsosauri]|uniref:TPM domain-containing protein n=1 Tax=Gracilibacillus dipsosauri TaxID=178340 RepID=A0A317L017_9BACI|nr:TPM domain-containing protein [Gracilibacillus dipsosauri]PWU69005.1 hypothetical protein DLJ74_11375 [Gracilibacillus dipsosauri]
MRISKKGLISILFLILFSFLTIPVSAEEQYIYDEADLFNADEQEELEKLAKQYSEENELSFLVLTENDLGGRDVVQYTEDFYDENAPGYDKKHGNTVILTIDMNKSEVYLSGFGDKQKYLSDSRLDEIREKITPYLSADNFLEATKQFFSEVPVYLGVNPIISPDSIFLKTWFQLLLAVLIGAVIVGAMIFNMGGRVTVKHETYVDPKNSRVVNRKDVYLRKTVSKTKIQKNNSSGNGGGGVTSGGHSHTGSRGGF